MTKTIKFEKPLFREFSLKREAVNETERTVELAFSSEEPVDRYWGTEILDHSPKAVRLERLQDGGPLLMDHKTSDQIGVVQDVSIGSDRVGRAVVRFGKGARASEIFQDVVDGIRSKVSVGYQIHKMILDSTDGDKEIYRINDWEPLEISLVAVPADASVGVGRSIEVTETHPRKEKRMPNENPTNEPAAPAAVTATPAAEVRSAVDDALTKERGRVSDINKIAGTFEKFGGLELARQYINEGKSVAEFQAALLERMGKKEVPSAELGLSDKEVRNFSFVRAINALANPKDARAQEDAAYEFDVSQAAANKSKKASRGILIPVDVLRRPLLEQRDLTKGTSTAGGHTVATDLLASSFIDLLRNRMVTQRMGAFVLNGLVGNIAIPRQTSGATAYWVAESGAPTESQPAFDQVTMSPKTVGAFVDMSRKLLIQSSIDVEAFVRNDLVKVIGLELDRAALYGSGSSNQPLGLKNVSGLNTKDFAAAAATWAEIVALETEVSIDNADIGTLAYLVNARGRGALKTTEKASSTGQFIWENNNTVNGYRAEVSNQVEGTAGSTEDHWFGNWADLVIGFWSGIDLAVDPYTGGTSGTVRVIGLQDADIAVRHPESFCRGANTL